MSYFQTIYDLLRQSGFTEAAALGMLGNWRAESGCEPNRLQNDFSSYRTPSKDYTARVTSGAISRKNFGSDERGYGLAQWTYVDGSKTRGRKYDLYDFWKKSGKKLDSVEMQVGFCLWELKNGYAHVRKKLEGQSDLYTCVKIICEQYEQPYYNNISDRYRYANEIKAQINLNAWQVQQPELTESGEPVSTENPQNPNLAWEKIPATEYWPPRMICAGMKGPDVEVLQAILKARAWTVNNPDGIFGSYLESIVKQFQEAYGLDADGIVGPITWRELLSVS